MQEARKTEDGQTEEEDDDVIKKEHKKNKNHLFCVFSRSLCRGGLRFFVAAGCCLLSLFLISPYLI